MFIFSGNSQAEQNDKELENEADGKTAHSGSKIS